MKKLITDFEMVITGILLGLFIFMASPMMLPKSNVISISSTKLINAVTFEISRNQVNYSKTEAVHTDAAPIIPAEEETVELKETPAEQLETFVTIDEIEISDENEAEEILEQSITIDEAEAAEEDVEEISEYEELVVIEEEMPAEKPELFYSDVPFYGRLRVESAGFSVGLYSSMDQYVCDREDSACCFSIYGYPGKIVGDHNYQEFRGIYRVNIGDTATIEHPDGTVATIVCREALEGHNTESSLTNSDYGPIPNGDFAFYTCMECWQNVYITIWDYVA